MTTVRFSRVGGHRDRQDTPNDPKGLKMSRTKTALHLPRVGGRSKLIALLVIAAFVWWVIQNPAGAADAVSTVVHGIAAFVKALH
jgi:hypothetical protein